MVMSDSNLKRQRLVVPAMDLELQVSKGQEALGKLIRQFLAINGFKHVQFMTMAHAVTGVRWLHSSQVSTLKRGGTRHLTGFPLFSVAAVNRRLYEVNNNLQPVPPGTRASDWKDKRPMLRPDGQPLDVGDLWRIYFGEMEAPLFNEEEAPEITDQLAQALSQQLHRFYLQHCASHGQEPMAYLPAALALMDSDAETRKLLRGVLLGVLELDPLQLEELQEGLASWMSQLTGKEISGKQLFALAALD